MDIPQQVSRQVATPAKLRLSPIPPQDLLQANTVPQLGMVNPPVKPPSIQRAQARKGSQVPATIKVNQVLLYPRHLATQTPRMTVSDSNSTRLGDSQILPTILHISRYLTVNRLLIRPNTRHPDMTNTQRTGNKDNIRRHQTILPLILLNSKVAIPLTASNHPQAPIPASKALIKASIRASTLGEATQANLITAHRVIKLMASSNLNMVPTVSRVCTVVVEHRQPQGGEHSF